MALVILLVKRKQTLHQFWAPIALLGIEAEIAKEAWQTSKLTETAANRSALASKILISFLFSSSWKQHFQ